MSLGIAAMDGFSFGADPELFVFDAEGKPVSAAGLIPGTKEEPFKVNCGAVQVDGMAAEFNINPSYTFEEFDNNIVTVMSQLKKMLPKGYSLQALPSVSFSPDQWDDAPEEAKELGCSPDFNAWTGDTNPPPMDATDPRMRCAGGHIHIGWTEDEDLGNIEHIQNGRDLVKQLDWYLGAWSLQKDTDPVRRRLYGKAGACRYKPYGVEYRVLSNFWVGTKQNRLNVWNRTNQAIFDMRNKFIPDVAHRFDMNNSLVKSINTSTRDTIMEKRFYFPVSTMDSSYKNF